MPAPELVPGTSIHGFTVQTCEPLSEIDGDAIVMHHEKSGARLLFLRNNDANKSFSITFKTPPTDDTGVFHILEHSVLCGSDKFPVKEPFVNLLKSSMQTFLNALTFPDKTMYPVASTNDQDLMNLMDVYMDAVLNPNIYSKRAIFEQEGWHYELDEADEGEGEGPVEAAAVEPAAPAEHLRYNGVVFNEMKGALSDPESVLYRAMNAALFPGTCYACESGGDPRCIPTLTYEKYLDTHARHYRLDNSYIILYGDVDVDRMLGALDERYLSVCEPRTTAAPNVITLAEPRVDLDYTVPMDTAPENACVGLGYVIGTARDSERVLACDVLLDALMGGNESPIKRALLDAGIGDDATAFIVDAQAQPVVLFHLKGAHEGVKLEFMRIVEEEARQLVEGGIPRDLLEASLAQMAFDLRERDRGMADGVPLAMSAMAGWLYADDMPTAYLRYEEALAHMRAGLSEGYFERLLDELVLQSEHKALVDIVPTAVEGQTDEERELAATLASMSEADKQHVRDEVALLREHQEAPDAPEALACLPRLSVSDIGPGRADPPFSLDASCPLPCLRHDLTTRNIDYLYLYFDIGSIPFDELPYVSILCTLLSRLDTDEHTAAELDVHMRSHLGSLRFFAEATTPDGNPDDIALRVVVGTSAISEEVESLASIPREVWERTRFSDTSRIRDALVQKRVAMEQSFANEGHTRAMNRLAASYFPSGVLHEHMGGVEYYRFLKDLIEHFDERADDLCARLESIRARVFASPAVASFTGSAADCDRFWELAGNMGLARGDVSVHVRPAIPAPAPRSEAFIVPCDVCYVAKASDVRETGDYTGAWAVACNALSYDRLWNEVRVKGGAYGVGFRRKENGFARFYSYRDPGVDATLARFDECAQWLAAFDPSPEDMEGYIVSTVASHDAPTKPRAIARREDLAFFSGRDADWRERLRAQKLSATPEALRALAPALEKVAAEGEVCVFGNEALVRAASVELQVEKLL